MNSKKKYLLTTAVPMMVVIVVCTTWVALLLPQISDPMSVYFGDGGTTVRTLSPLWVVLLWSGMCVLLVGGFLLLTGIGVITGNASRFSAASTGFVVTLLSTTELTLFRMQAGAPDNESVLFQGTQLVIPVVAGGIVAALIFSITRPITEFINESRREFPSDFPEMRRDNVD